MWSCRKILGDRLRTEFPENLSTPRWFLGGIFILGLCLVKNWGFFDFALSRKIQVANPGLLGIEF